MKLCKNLALNSIHGASFSLTVSAMEKCWEGNDLKNMKEATKTLKRNMLQMQAHIDETLDGEEE